MTQQLIGLLQVIQALYTKRREVDLDMIARLYGAPPDMVQAHARKLARWGLIDRHGRVTPRGVAMTARVRTRYHQGSSHIEL